MEVPSLPTTNSWHPSDGSPLLTMNEGILKVFVLFRQRTQTTASMSCSLVGIDSHRSWRRRGDIVIVGLRSLDR